MKKNNQNEEYYICENSLLVKTADSQYVNHLCEMLRLNKMQTQGNDSRR